MQCPKCGSHVEHIRTVEVNTKTGERWVIERCPRCEYAGWPDNPIPYVDHFKNRAQDHNVGRGFWGIDGIWYPGVRNG